MKLPLMICSLGLAMLAFVGSAAAQPTIRLSWNGCDPQTLNKNYSAPAVYTLVASASNVSDGNYGHDLTLVIGPAVPDAWRFDDGGCQSGQLTYLTSAVNKATCPTLNGANALLITQFVYDHTAGKAQLRATITYDPVFPVVSTRYTLWQFKFDHSLSIAGTDADPSTCDGAGNLLAIAVQEARLSALDGRSVILVPEFGGVVTWNSQLGQTQMAGGNSVIRERGYSVEGHILADPVAGATWARLKASYR